MISVIIPIFQTEKYIEKCIWSLLNQTYKNFELILVNDGTKDLSVEKAEKVLEKSEIDYKIVCEKNENGEIQNKGLACARNLGIKHASKEWILCIDSDDYIHPKTIEIFVSQIKQMEDANVLICDYKNVSESFSLRQYLNKEVNGYTTEKITQEKILRLFFERKMRTVIPSVLVKREFLMKNGIEYPSDSRFSEDQIYLWKVFLCCDFVCYIHKELYFYVHRGNSIMTSSSLHQISLGYISGMRAFEEFKMFAENKINNLNTTITYESIVARWILGLTHSTAMLLEYKEYCSFLNLIQYKSRVRHLLYDKDLKTCVATMLLLCNKKLYYKISRRSLRNYCDTEKEGL